MSMNGMDISINQVTVRYDRQAALDNVSMVLESGKIYGLIGRNGAGKTTLLSLIASFMKPTEGTLTVGGKTPFEDEELMSCVTLVYAANYAQETETVKGMLEAAERYRPNFDREYAGRLAKLFKLPMDKQMKQLSSGMQSAANVVIGLASRCPVTIFDEAYLGMDAPARELFYREVLEEHARNPRTIILSTHLVSEMDYLFEQVIILNRGQVLLDEPIDRLLERGASVTGAAEEAERFTRDMKCLNVRQLGGTKSVMVYGEIPDAKRREAQRLGLDIGPVSLQDLFIHLTGGDADESGQ